MSCSRFPRFGMPMLYRLRGMQRRLIPELNACFPYVFEDGPRKLVYVEYAEVNRTQRPRRGFAEKEGKQEPTEQDASVFKVAFNVSNFKPSEIKIKAADYDLIIEGERETDDLTKRFVRHYVLPGELDINTLKSSMSKDGILTIEAKKIIEKESKGEWKSIDIEWEAATNGQK